MAEAHEALVAVLHALDEGGDVLLRADAPQHPQHRLVGAAVQRAVERADTGRDGRVGVDLRGADGADRVGRAVLLVVGVQDEEHVEGLDQSRVGLELLLAHLEEHREEVGGVAEVVVGVDERLALRVAERPRAEGRHLRDHAHDLHVAVVRVADVAGVGVERRQRADRGHQHAHRVGVVAEAVHERLDVLVHERVVGDLVHPGVVLLLGGQRAVDEEVGHLEEVGLLRQLLDRVAAVLEDALVAVDERDGRAARGGVHEAGVIGGQTRLLVGETDLSQVLGRDRVVGDRDVVLLTGPVVGDSQGILGRYVGHVGSCSYVFVRLGSDQLSRGPRASANRCPRAGRACLLGVCRRWSRGATVPR